MGSGRLNKIKVGIVETKPNESFGKLLQGVSANVEFRYCEVGRSGSLINFYPEGKSPLRGYIRNADMSQRDWSTTWIGPQSGYVPTGLVHYVD